MVKTLTVSALLASTLLMAAQNPKPIIASLTATVEDVFVQRLQDGSQINKTIIGNFYRDSQGRTRIDRDKLVTIQDPTTRTNLVIDMGKKVAKRFVLSNIDSKPGTNSVLPSMTGVKSPERNDLGNKIIEGVTAIGMEFSVVIPPGAVSNLVALKQTTEVWFSQDLGLVLLMKSSSPLSGTHTQTYHNIVRGAAIDPALFSIPGDVTVEDINPEPSTGTGTVRPSVP